MEDTASIPVIPTVGVLIIKDDSVLMVRHGDAASHITGVYGLPAGRLEDGETPKQAAVRELQEETGLIAAEDSLEELSIDVPYADIPRKDGTIKRFSITMFLCRNYSGEVPTVDPQAETIPEWVPLAKIPSLQLLPNVAYVVSEGKKFL